MTLITRSHDSLKCYAIYAINDTIHDINDINSEINDINDITADIINKIAFQQDAYHLLVAHISQHALRRGVSGPGGGVSLPLVPRGACLWSWGVYPSMQWGRPPPWTSLRAVMTLTT